MQYKNQQRKNLRHAVQEPKTQEMSIISGNHYSLTLPTTCSGTNEPQKGEIK